MIMANANRIAGMFFLILVKIRFIENKIWILKTKAFLKNEKNRMV